MFGQYSVSNGNKNSGNVNYQEAGVKPVTIKGFSIEVTENGLGKSVIFETKNRKVTHWLKDYDFKRQAEIADIDLSDPSVAMPFLAKKFNSARTILVGHITKISELYFDKTEEGLSAAKQAANEICDKAYTWVSMAAVDAETAESLTKSGVKIKTTTDLEGNIIYHTEQDIYAMCNQDIEAVIESLNSRALMMQQYAWYFATHVFMAFNKNVEAYALYHWKYNANKDAYYLEVMNVPRYLATAYTSESGNVSYPENYYSPFIFNATPLVLEKDGLPIFGIKLGKINMVKPGENGENGDKNSADNTSVVSKIKSVVVSPNSLNRNTEEPKINIVLNNDVQQNPNGDFTHLSDDELPF